MPLNENTIHIAIELSTSIWLVGTRLPGATKSRMHRIAAGDTAALLALVGALQERPVKDAGRAPDLACCFEAGRDGFWLHRLLTANGVLTYVVEPTSILVNRRARRAKTDRLDAEGLLRVLAAYVGGDYKVCSMVRVPTPEQEDAKRTHPEREHLVQERTRFENRILALLATQGIRERPSLRSWERKHPGRTASSCQEASDPTASLQSVWSPVMFGLLDFLILKMGGSGMPHLA